ncbi:cytochrome c family protein [Mariniblastus fucicola]|nr:cytochrome c family protein [Mariniblastus fucicola]
MLKVSAAVVFITCLVSHIGLQAAAQGLVCDPSKVMTFESCANCHGSEIRVWRQTPHFKTFEELSRNPKAREICSKMGLSSVKRSNVCIDCHFTLQEIDGRNKAVSGISCESCHGASRDWLALHNDYGGPTATKESESESHRKKRLKQSAKFGMNNTRDLYSIAMNCYSCHMVPNEDLVNIGGHTAGTAEFDLVRYSQGQIRHNFLRSNGAVNEQASQDRLRMMHVVGLIADLEFSTRATAIATENGTYGVNVAQRAAASAVKLFELQKAFNNEQVQRVLEAFAKAKLNTNNYEQLNEVADEIQQAGREFAVKNDGSEMAFVDALLPSPSQYK